MLDSTRGDEVPAQANTTPLFWWYNQADFAERWNNRAWGDETMARGFDDYLSEALEEGWWDGLDHPRKEEEPQVYIECGGNTMRRTRGGRKVLDRLWSKLKSVIVIDFKMTATAQQADYFLPAAQHYEKIAFAISGLKLESIAQKSR